MSSSTPSKDPVSSAEVGIDVDDTAYIPSPGNHPRASLSPATSPPPPPVDLRLPMYSSPGSPFVSDTGEGGAAAGEGAVLTPGEVPPSNPSPGKSLNPASPTQGRPLTPSSLAAELGVDRPLMSLRFVLPVVLGRTPPKVEGGEVGSTTPTTAPAAAAAAPEAAVGASSVVVKVGEGGVKEGGEEEVVVEGAGDIVKPPFRLPPFCSRDIVGLACMAILLALALGLGLGLGLKPNSGGVGALASPTPSPAPSASSRMANVTKVANVVSGLGFL
jgi:hypothetical protein